MHSIMTENQNITSIEVKQIQNLSYIMEKPRKNELNPYRKPIEPLNYYAFLRKSL